MSVDGDILSAVRYELAEYLRTYLTPLFGTDTDPASPYFGKSLLTVRETWPTPGKRLNEYDVTVLATGAVDDWWFYPPEKVSVVPTTPGTGLVTYCYGYLEGLQLSLDCFSTAPTKRDELCRNLRRALNRPPQQTMPALTQQNFLMLDQSFGLVLPLTRLYGSACDYEFEPVAAPIETSEAAKSGEWRASYRGGASFDIYDQQLFALITRLGLTVNTGKVSQTKFLP